MFPSTQPLLSVFFSSSVSVVWKSWCFFLFTSTSGWFYPFSRGHSLQKDAFAVLYICFPPINFAHLPSVRWWIIHYIIFSHARLFCQTIMWTANLMVLVKVYYVADRSEVHRVKVRSCSGWQAKVGYYSIRSFFCSHSTHKPSFGWQGKVYEWPSQSFYVLTEQVSVRTSWIIHKKR